MSKCYKCGEQWTNENRVETPLLCPKCSLAAPTGSAFLRTITEGLAVVACFETLQDCYQQGQAASSQGYRRDQNPYQVGIARREWWDGGWCNEGDELCGER